MINYKLHPAVGMYICEPVLLAAAYTMKSKV